LSRATKPCFVASRGYEVHLSLHRQLSPSAASRSAWRIEMITRAQLFVCLNVASLATICTFPRGTGGLLNGLGGSRGGTNVARVNHYWARGLCLLASMATFFVSLQPRKLFLNTIVCLALNITTWLGYIPSGFLSVEFGIASGLCLIDTNNTNVSNKSQQCSNL
jgi:hypothetical protein